MRFLHWVIATGHWFAQINTELNILFEFFAESDLFTGDGGSLLFLEPFAGNHQLF